VVVFRQRAGQSQHLALTQFTHSHLAAHSQLTTARAIANILFRAAEAAAELVFLLAARLVVEVVAAQEGWSQAVLMLALHLIQ
jgi:3-methyladenine DNA glycosylase Mpg